MNKIEHTITHNGQKITGSGEVYTFAYLHTASKHFLQIAEQTKEGQLYNLMSSMIYCAFTLEALIHHIGELKFGDEWKKYERKRPKEKLKLLKTKNGWDLELGSSPFQTFDLIFSYRDDIVHGKTEINIAPTIKPEKKLPIDFDAEWMEFTNLETAKTFVEDTDLMVVELITLTNHRKLIPGQMGFSTYSSTPLKETENDF